ncbi:MAG TPA: hypothetical protein VFG01_03680 [Acidobacteriota bacterium]|nr:hypothetical protein [Acidobacteriota bacterium]
MDNDWKKMKEGKDLNHFPLGIVVISVIMFFAALATDIFWLAKILGKGFPQTMPVSSKVYNAFVWPDLVLSLFLYVGAVGLIQLKKFGFIASLVGMGMWIFDLLLIWGITGSSRLDIILPSLLFALFTVYYLWTRRELFA